MRQITLDAIPNQFFVMQLDGDTYNIALRTINNGDAELSIIDIYINDSPIVLGQRIVPSTLIIPYPYLNSANFILLTRDDELPNYRAFNLSQFLIYISQDDFRSL